MDLHILNNPNLLPPDQVAITRVAATPYPDRRRIKVEIEVTPFKERPNLEIAILDGDGTPVASASVIAIMQFQIAFNLHLRGLHDPAGNYTARVLLYYEDVQSPQDTGEAVLHIPPADTESASG
ncbi:MAG: hypothetical protein JXQ72_00265 [Anaerolineae bacterium]|nr:hypothetical protein [Anaerolineae bacterium]